MSSPGKKNTNAWERGVTTVEIAIFLTVKFQRIPSYSVQTPPCANACINICAHVKDPVVQVRVQWITETLKPTACTVGWVA